MHCTNKLLSNLHWLLGSIGTGSSCAVHPEVGPGGEHKGCEAVAEGTHDGIDGVVEGDQQGNEPYKQSCTDTNRSQLGCQSIPRSAH